MLLERGPRRTLALATFISMIGNGLFMTGAALFFTRSVGLSVTQVGLAMGVAALVGLVAGVPAGRVADRHGPRETYLVIQCVQAAAMAALVLVHSFWAFVLTISLTQFAASAGAAARGPLTRGFAGPNPTKYRSYLRATANLAGACGAVMAGVVVQVDTRGAYVALILANALSFLLCAAIVTRLPHLPPVREPEPMSASEAPSASQWGVLKDLPYAVVTALDSLLSLQGHVLVFALPLWIVGHSQTPHWLIGACGVVNTLMVVAFQVRASRGVVDNASAGRGAVRSGVAFLLGMAAIAAAAGMPGWLAAVLIVAGVVVHTIGELWHAAASFELSFGLAPARAQGQYSGLQATGTGLASSLAPSVLALFCITWGVPGWLALGGVFVLAGLAMPSAVRWAEQSRAAAAGQDAVLA
ncbi:MFS transporter [Streptomyces sp. NBC_00102]|uniref:MFS transporter n=1 Tax=Streptomyces sp. NBC_00102 TaxID=2975652 RepID=UPI00225BBE7C|nr:MFS transporter [Streptomyces sp. NBC_00102]MCX5401987.1 MFS transporter [Streptomyces sp. NBC_00102]